MSSNEDGYTFELEKTRFDTSEQAPLRFRVTDSTGAAVMRYVGVSIKTLFKIFTEPRWEATFILPEEGLYIIRCQAIRHNPDDAEVTRPPSVAYLPVFARHPREMAANGEVARRARP